MLSHRSVRSPRSLLTQVRLTLRSCLIGIVADVLMVVFTVGSTSTYELTARLHGYVGACQHFGIAPYVKTPRTLIRKGPWGRMSWTPGGGFGPTHRPQGGGES